MRLRRKETAQGRSVHGDNLVMHENAALSQAACYLGSVTEDLLPGSFMGAPGGERPRVEAGNDATVAAHGCDRVHSYRFAAIGSLRFVGIEERAHNPRQTGI